MTLVHRVDEDVDHRVAHTSHGCAPVLDTDAETEGLPIGRVCLATDDPDGSLAPRRKERN